MSYQAVREVIDQAIYLETLTSAQVIEQSQAFHDEAVANVSARTDQMISELKPADRQRLRRIVEILRNRLK